MDSYKLHFKISFNLEDFLFLISYIKTFMPNVFAYFEIILPILP